MRRSWGTSATRPPSGRGNLALARTLRYTKDLGEMETRPREATSYELSSSSRTQKVNLTSCVQSHNITLIVARTSSALSDSERNEGICAEEVDQGQGMSKLISHRKAQGQRRSGTKWYASKSCDVSLMRINVLPSHPSHPAHPSHAQAQAQPQKQKISMIHVHALVILAWAFPGRWLGDPGLAKPTGQG
jgi:hypothetical protein